MKIGFVGLGKLGLPCAVAMDMHGHEIMGFDIEPSLMSKKPRPYRETGPDGNEPFTPYLEKSNLQFGSLQEVANFSEIIFLAVQTPHDAKYEGITRIPEDRIDFDYRYLKESIKNLAEVVTRDTVIIIISTVLPGTIRNQVLPLANEQMKICYNPFFIAMGTTMRDFLNPEFILFGVHDTQAAEKAEAFYKSITNSKFYKTTVENAELIKVSYNTFIGMKIVFANTLMEICQKTPGTNVTEVTNALKLANRRLMSSAYLDAGMGDGGGCHPRDNIAMSWLARKLDLSYDFFDSLMIAREKQTEWLVELINDEMAITKLPLIILGKSFKRETNIVVGSPALLLANILKEKAIRFVQYDPYVDEELLTMREAIYFVATDHVEFDQLTYPEGSTIIDPWGHVTAKAGVKLVSVGRAGEAMLKEIGIEAVPQHKCKKNVISLLCPTRGRPEGALRLAKSLLETSNDPKRIELFFYIDEDDSSQDQYIALLNEWLDDNNDPFAVCEVTIGPAISISESWNTIAARANGDLLVMANDDQVYKTIDWDNHLDEEVSQYDDGIFCMWFEDGINGPRHCAFPIVSRVWYETLGYFTPGIFKFIYNDTWIMELGKRCGRLHFIDFVFVEHRHFTVGKSVFDETYQRHRDPADNHVEHDKALFEKTESLRMTEAERLLTVIQDYSSKAQKHFA